MAKLFISHSSRDDAFVRELRRTLADLKQQVWIDSRELRGGDLLWPGIRKAIEESSAVAVVVSPNSGSSAEFVGICGVDLRRMVRIFSPPHRLSRG